MKTINYNRPALHRKYIDEGKMTIEESDKLIKEWEKSEAERELSLKDSIKINKMVHKFGIGIMENIDRWGDWKDRHGAYQNDEGEWEV